MSKHSAPRRWRVGAMLRKIIAFPVVIMVIIATAVAGFMATSANAATVTTSGDQDCTYEWVREIPQSHKEYKYSKTIPAVPGVMEYKYKKSVTDYETQYRFLYQKKVKGDVYKKKDGYTEKVGTFDFEWFEAPTWNGGPLTHWGDWGYDANTEQEGPHKETSKTYQVDGKTYVKKSTYYTYFKTTAKPESRTIDTGSHFEYSEWTTEVLEYPWYQIDERWKTEPQPEQTVLYKDGAWTTDTPGSPWVKIDERSVQDTPIKQGPVRSAEAPPLNYDGVNSNVAWTKVPGSEECPPEEPTEVKVPVGPEHVDPCNPPGVTNNVAWMESLREDTPQIDWSEDIAKGTRTATLKGNTVWDDGTKAPKVFTLPADSGVQCVVPPTPITVPTVPVVDECGIGNAHYGEVPSGNYTVVRNQDGSITLTAKDGYVFPNGQSSITLPKPVEKNTAPCPEPELASVVVKAFCGYVEFTNPAANVETVTVLYGSFDNESEDGSTDVAPGKTVKVPTKRTTLDFVSLGVESGTYAGTGSVKVSQECGTNPPPKPPVPPKSEEPNKPPFKPTPVKPVVTAPPVVKGPRVETDGGPSGPSGFMWIALLGASALTAAGLRRRTARR